MPPKPKTPSAKAQDWPAHAPIVFHVRPTKFQVVTPSELKDWEASRAAALGVKVKDLGRTKGTGTWSFSPIGGGYDTFDDSDEI